MGTFRCSKCGSLVDLMYVNRHECGAPGPRGGYSRRDGSGWVDKALSQADRTLPDPPRPPHVPDVKN
jgi:hypothetical protein